MPQHPNELLPRRPTSAFTEALEPHGDRARTRGPVGEAMAFTMLLTLSGSAVIIGMVAWMAVALGRRALGL